MPSIILNQTTTYETLTHSGFENVRVVPESYPNSNLFTRYKHTFKPPLSGNILIYNDKLSQETNSLTFDSLGNHLTLNFGRTHKVAILGDVYVYFNRYDANAQHPLLLVLLFAKAKPPIENKYYTRSDFESKIAGSESVDISSLKRYQNDQDIFADLIKENYRLSEPLTFDIGKTKADDEDNYIFSNTYNNNKIIIEDSSKSDLSGLNSGFKRYTHKYERSQTAKNACIIYNNNLLIGESKSPIEDVQNKQYDHINVYWSNKVAEPLLIELNTNRSRTNTNEFYYHTRDTDDSLIWKKVNTSENVLGVQFDQNEINGFNDINSSYSDTTIKLLKALETHLQKTIIIMIDKKGQYQQSTFKTSFTNSSKYRLINNVIRPADKTSTKGKCLDKTGFKVYEHDFTDSVNTVKAGQETVRLRLIIPNSSSTHQYEEITLHKTDSRSDGDTETLEYKPQNKKLYVYFYGDKDPRPLLVCYNGCAYKPRKTAEPMQVRQVMVEYAEWVKVDKVSTCTCQNGGTSGSPNQEILKELNDVVGFLNPVQINPNEIPNSASAVTTSYGTQQYTLHTYLPDETIKMGISRNTLTCYKKFQYQPYGTNGQSSGKLAEGFRLGTVFHTKTSHSTTRSTLNYTTLSESYKYHPLVGVTVYYYDQDKGYDDPLLIELEYKVGIESWLELTHSEYYKLQPGDTSNTRTWERDYYAQYALRDRRQTQKLIEHLDGIRYSLKPVVKILLDKQKPYQLCLSSEPGGKNGGYSQNGDHTITVEACNEGGCTELSDRGYKCYVHQISKLNGGVRFDYNKIGGIKFYISGKSGSDDVEIPLHDEDESKLDQLTYNTCMDDVYVYFYCNSNGKQVDKVPLMLRYNNRYYRPEERDKYFTNWIHESWFDKFKKPCGTEREQGDDSYLMLLTMLDFTNQELNRIDLDCPKVTHGKYGLPLPGGGKQLSSDFNTDRVTLTCQNGPSKQPISDIYKRVTHRTVNGYRIGYIYYDNKDITEDGGIEVNGSPKISIELPGHENFADDNKPNTVVAYYHKDDDSYKLPQLIVLLHTEKAIEQGSEPITAKPSTKYGYYVLSTNAVGYKYEWRTVDDPQPKPFTLDDPTEFSLLNSVIILVDQQSLYDESAINSALTKSDSIRSPGNESGVNRLQGKEISVNNKTTDSGKCVSTYGYKLFEHDLTAITTQIHGIKPILGLRFLIPSETTKDSYNEIILHTDENALNTVGPLYHTSTNNTVYVYFYDKDPRPLLLCYGNDAYKPFKQAEPTVDKQVDVDYKKWTKVDGIIQCVFENSETDTSNKILETLLKVVLFLNPVQLNPRKLHSFTSSVITAESSQSPKTPKEAIYKLHQYKYNSYVKMKIIRDDVKCYEKYTYEPDGTGSGGEGFRLGTVIYTSKNNSIKTLDYPNEIAFLYDPLVKVTVYYYDHDKQYEDPLLIELDFTKIIGSGTQIIDYKEYYKLSQAGDGTTTVDWKLDPYAQKHIGNAEQEKLINYLDKIRYQFKKVLQICIAVKQTKTYPAKLFDKKTDKPPESNEQINVTVSEESNSGSLTGTGFRCFKHKITELGSTNLHKFAALRFVIPSRDSAELVKLNLYDAPPTGLLNQLYYNCGMGDIYVYFYGKGNDNGGQGVGDGDPRPLLLCYNSKGYRAWSMTTYDSQIWLKSSYIKDCTCKTSDTKLLEELVKVCNFLNPINIQMVQDGPYKVHRFNGQNINIKVTGKSGSDGFCYKWYTHSPEKEGFRLGRIDYGSDTQGARSGKCIQLSNHDSSSHSGEETCINAVLDEPREKSLSASQVIVYYYSKDTSHEIPLLVVLCDNANNGAISKQYYELQRTTDSNEPKKYTKHLTNLSLDTTKDGQLERLLDKRLSGMSKSLQIILGKRLDPIPLCPIERKRIKLLKTKKPLDQLSYEDLGLQLLTNALFGAAEISQYMVEEGLLQYHNPNSYEYINENDCTTREKQEFDLKIKTRIPSYPARVYKNDGIREQGPSGTALIKVQKIESKELANTGYVCYRHKLLNIPNINEFNGLRLFLWDNRTSEDNDSQCKPTPPTTLDTKPKCCEIDLHGEDKRQITPIAYTTCKGDLYVYFYGSDPRPMLLCYNGQSYAPTDLATYSQKWCRVSEITSCECSDKAFKPEQALLDTLYKTSMFLNPVNLWETMEAYEKVKPITMRKHRLLYLIQI